MEDHPLDQLKLPLEVLDAQWHQNIIGIQHLWIQLKNPI